MSDSTQGPVASVAADADGAPRLAGLDALRGLAVAIMVLVVAVDAATSDGAACCRALRDVTHALGPFVSAAFVFIAGLSLVRARRRRRDAEDWFPWLLSRAALLYSLGVTLYVAQFGPSLPDALLSPNVLSVIALSLLLTGPLLLLERPGAALSALLAAELAVALWLELSGELASGLNVGQGAAFPLVAFATMGAIVGRVRERFGDRALVVAAAIATPALFVPALTGLPWGVGLPMQVADHGGRAALLVLLQGGDFWRPTALHVVETWHHGVAGFFATLVPLVVLTALFLPARCPPAARGACALGRHSLVAYLTLLPIAGLVRALDAGRSSLGAAAGLLLTFATVGAAVAAAARCPARRTREVTTSASPPATN